MTTPPQGPSAPGQHPAGGGAPSPPGAHPPPGSVPPQRGHDASDAPTARPPAQPGGLGQPPSAAHRSDWTPPAAFPPGGPYGRVPSGPRPPYAAAVAGPPLPSGPVPVNRVALVIGVLLGLVVLILGALGVLGIVLAARGVPDEPLSAPAGSAVGGGTVGDTGGAVEVAVEVGGCVELAGTEDAAVARPAACGSAEANHKVVGKTPTAAECVGDSDVVYSEPALFGLAEAGALCLDVDWVRGDCFELGEVEVRRVDCAAPGTDVVRVVETIQGTSDEFACEIDAVVYPERNFVVCLDHPGDLVPS